MPKGVNANKHLEEPPSATIIKVQKSDDLETLENLNFENEQKVKIMAAVSGDLKMTISSSHGT